jgi:hypothetical protein
MQFRSLICTSVGIVLASSLSTRPAHAQLWKQFIPVSHSEAMPKGDGTLTENNGPWMIMAMSFQGDGAQDRAQKLVDELRQRFRIAAYLHDRNFDFAEGNPGRGLDVYGARPRSRYQREAAHEFAVLVGDFQAIDDPEAQQMLDRIKTLQPNSLKAVDEDASSATEKAKQAAASVLPKSKKKERGPMGKAFMTRNPLLPQEYFVPKGVDSFVAKMNKGVEHSLLDCPGKYTVQVATFRGQTILQTNNATKPEPSSYAWTWRKEKNDPLIEAAENAHLLTEELRAHGWEAYEFHDRSESYVTIGSFDQVAIKQANGQLVPTREVQRIVETFGAAYDTPSDPLTGDDVRKQRRADELKEQFTQMLSKSNNSSGQLAPGMNPKHVKIMHGKRVDRMIPMDVYPHTIDVPRQSISGAYATK